MHLPSISDLSNPDRLTSKAIEALRLACYLAWERHHRHIAPEHLLLALAKMEPNVAREVLNELGLDLATELEQVNTLVAAIRPAAEP